MAVLAVLARKIWADGRASALSTERTKAPALGTLPTTAAPSIDISDREVADQTPRMPLKSRSTERLLHCVLLCLAVGVVGLFIAISQNPAWYAGLTKPSWMPTPVVFPMVWTAVYVSMGVPLWRLRDKLAPSAGRARMLGLFALQLALNAIWFAVFFGHHQVRAALVVLAALSIVLFATIIAMVKFDRVAAWLLAPYLLLVAYATTLNAGIVALN